MTDADAPLFHAAGMTEVPVDDEWLTVPEAERLASFPYAKRRSEARLGRWTAKNAVARVLHLGGWRGQLDGIVIRNAADGAPEVFLADTPAPFRISMTDRADWAVCVVTQEGADVDVGCDLEVVEPRSRQFVRDWFTPLERDLVYGGDDADLLANLVWSAKESALKVLRTGLRRDTRSVEVRLFADERDGWNRMEIHSVEGSVFPGWWRRAGAFVFTFAASRPTIPPAALDRPDPLDTAMPSHSWMDEPLQGSPATRM